MNTSIRMKQRSLFFALLLTVLTGTVQAADPVKGDGHPVTKTMEVTDFNAIRINGIMQFEYEQTEVPSGVIEITLDENLFAHLQTEVKDRVLSMKFRDVKVDQVTRFVVKANAKWLKSARVEGNAHFIALTPLTGDELEIRANENCLVELKEPVTAGLLRFKINGSANVVAEQIEASRLECDMDGSGSINLKTGKAANGLYSIVGGSDLHAFGVEVDELNCRMTTGGLAEIHVATKLKASIMGKGTIRYKGKPEIQQSTIGKGKIENAN